jgi:hypothetical protein
MKTLRTIALASLLTACVGAPDEDTAAPAGDEPVYTETVVHVENGKLVVDDQREITRSQELASNAQKAALAAGDTRTAYDAAVDSSCAATSLWLYDQPNRTGNKLCFSGTGYSLPMNNYSTPIRLGHVIVGWENWQQIYNGSAWAGNAYTYIYACGDSACVTDVLDAQFAPYGYGSIAATYGLYELYISPF